MSNPSVTATISANDLASPRIRELMATLKQAEKLANDAFSGDGVGRKYASGINQATAAVKKHVGVLHEIHAAHKAIAATVAGYAGMKLLHGGIEAVSHYLPYGRELTRMQAITGFGSSDMKTLERQQAQMAQKWGLMVEDTLKAQEEFAARGYNAGITGAAAGQSIIASRALGMSAQDSAKLMEGITFGRGVTLTSPEQTEAEMKHSADLAAIANKKGAMSGEDITQFAKYALGLSTAANISPETAFAAAMVLKKNNVGGDESGTFMRAMSARLLAPTRPAYDALAHMGLNYADYSTQGPVSVDAIDRAALRRYGKGLSSAGKAELQKQIDDGTAMESREAFASAVRKSLEASGENLSRTDLKHTVDAALKQYDMSRSGLQGDRLFRDIIERGSAQEIAALIGDKHGGRAAMIVNNREAFSHAIDEQNQGAGFAESVAIKRQQDLASAVDRLKASFDSLELSLVRTNEVWLTPMVNAATSVASAFNGLDDATKEAVGILAGLTTVVTGGGLAYALVSLTMSAGQAAIALKALAAGSVLPGVPAAVPAAAAGTVVAAGLGLSTLALGAAGTYMQWRHIREGSDSDLDDMAGNWLDPDTAVAAAIERNQRKQRIWGDPPSVGAFDRFQPTMLDAPSSRYLRDGGADGVASRGWQDSIVLGNSKASQGFGDPGKNSTQVEVQGTVSGDAEIHLNVQGELRPTPYFTAMIQRAEAVANMGINGRLGTSMQGPGDNNTKAAAGALTGTQ